MNSFHTSAGLLKNSQEVSYFSSHFLLFHQHDYDVETVGLSVK